MTTEALNLRHWPDDAKGTYEVWYLTWNHAATGQGYWLRFVIEAPADGAARAELWFARFDPRSPARTFGVHRRYPISVVRSAHAPFELAIGTSRIGHADTTGAFDGDGHSIAWELRWDPAPQALRHLPDLMYARGGLGETTVQSPNPRVEMTGSLVVDGERLEFDRAVMGQTHVWGTKHAFSWAWARCAEWDDASDTLLELICVRLQRRGRMFPPMTVVSLVLDGELHRLNQFRHVVGNRSTWGDHRVHFTAQSLGLRLEGDFACAPEQMVNAPYLDPDGTRVYCVNTEIGDASLVISRRTGRGWREERRLNSHGHAHFELGGRQRDPAVTRNHVTVE